jgi:hypothetical protein
VPVSSNVHSPAPLTGLSSLLMADPSPFFSEYQLSRTKISPPPESTRPYARAEYHWPGFTSTSWVSHFVEDVVESSLAACWPW